MTLDGDEDESLRAALAAAVDDAPLHDFQIPQSVLDSVRELREPPPPPPPRSDAVLYVVHSIATANAAKLSDAVHTNHGSLSQNLIRIAVKALNTMGDEHIALECGAFVRYELRVESVLVELPADLDYGAFVHEAEANVRVTRAGYARLAATDPPAASEASKGYLAERPWLLELVLEQSPSSRQAVDSWWRFVVPGLLNYLDTTDLNAKARGVRLVQLMAQRFGEKLKYSGLAPVFEESVQPCLSFLPPLEDAVRTKLVFGPAVLCLGALAQLASDAGTRISRLNYVAREGCLNAFLHAYENVELTIYFFDTLREFVDTYAQSLTAVHLSGIVRIFTQVMTDPFIDASPPLAEAACRAMASAIKWAWPRIDTYKYTILLGLAKANALDTECFKLLQVSDEEETKLRHKISLSRDKALLRSNEA